MTLDDTSKTGLPISYARRNVIFQRHVTLGNAVQDVEPQVYAAQLSRIEAIGARGGDEPVTSSGILRRENAVSS